MSMYVCKIENFFFVTKALKFDNIVNAGFFLFSLTQS